MKQATLTKLLVATTLIGRIALGMLDTPLGFAQASDSSRPGQSFDAASIKLNKSVTGSSSTAFSRGGSFTAQAATVRGLIAEAYQTKADRLVAGPDWIGSETYDIIAKPEKPVTREQARLMLQALLADRFHLKVHNETRELPVYALTTGKNGAKLQEAGDANCTPAPAGPPTGPPPRTGYCGGSILTPGHMLSRKVTVQKLAGTLSEIVGRPVLDMTGLQGVFDIDMHWTPDDTQFRGVVKGDDPGAPSIFAALNELGLKLEARKGPVEVLVPDHAARPSPN